MVDVCTQARGEFFSFFLCYLAKDLTRENYPNLSIKYHGSWFGFTVTLSFKRSLISILEIPPFSLLTECQLFIFVALKNLDYEQSLGFFLI